MVLKTKPTNHKSTADYHVPDCEQLITLCLQEQCYTQFPNNPVESLQIQDSYLN